MNTLIAFGGGLFRWVLQSTWQAAVLAGLILLLQATFRKKLSAGWRHSLWLLLVIRLLMPISPQSAFSIFNLAKPRVHHDSPQPAPLAIAETSVLSSRAPIGQGTSSTPPQRHMGDEIVRSTAPSMSATATSASLSEHQASVAASPRRTNWFAVAAVIWLAGAALFGTRLLWSNWRFHRRISAYVPVSDEAVRSLFNDCASAIGVGARVILIETELVESPAICGLRRKKLLLPDGIFDRFSTGELRHIFLHELAHVKRRDLELNWIVECLRVLHWFNPALWLAFSRMRADRELAADALALAQGDAREHVPYGETILKVLEGLAGSNAAPGLVGIAESKARMKERLRAIARAGATRPWRWAAAGIAAAIALVALTNAQESGSRDKAGGPLDSSHKRFVLRLADDVTGVPLTGATVEFELAYHGAATRTETVRTDKEGRASVDVPMRDLKRFVYRAGNAGYLSLHGEWLEQETALLPAEFQIRLSQGAEVGGIVIDSDGKPLAGAEVYFNEPINMLMSNAPNSVIWSPPVSERLAVTGPDGTWKARCMWPGVAFAVLRVHHPEFADRVYSTEMTRAMEAEGKGNTVDFADLQSQRARFYLDRGVLVRGTVVDDSGNPLPRVHVHCADRKSQNPFWDQPMGKGEVMSDAQGKFEVRHMQQTELYFSVQEEGFAPFAQSFDLRPSALDGQPSGLIVRPGRATASGVWIAPPPTSPTRDRDGLDAWYVYTLGTNGALKGIVAADITLRLKEPTRFSGRVLDREGQPISGARLTFEDSGKWQGVRWEATTDEQGGFQWNDAPNERFLIQLQKEGFITYSHYVGNDAGPVELRMNPKLRISGRVVDANTRKPIDRFQVLWLDRSRPEDFRGYRLVAIPGTNGLYTADLGRLKGDTWGGDGYAHQCMFRVEAPGYAPAISRVFVSQKGDVGEVTYNMELTPVAQISGTVLDADGAPVAGAQVLLRTPTTRATISGKPRIEAHRALGSSAIPVTDSAGQFSCDRNPEAIQLVIVHEKGVAMLGTNEFAPRMTVHLQRWGRIEGRIWNYDQAIGNQDVWMDSTVDNSWPGGMGTRLISFSGTADANGRFAFEYVPPGKYHIYRMIPMPGGGASGGNGVVVQLGSGATETVKLGGTGRPVVGRFKITNPYVSINWQRQAQMNWVRSVSPQPPAGLKTEEEFDAWRNKPEIARALDQMRTYPIQFETNGSFKLDEVVPGKYGIQVTLLDPRDPEAFAYSKYIARFDGSFEVPDSPDANSRKPFDVGTFEVTLKSQVELGKTKAPEFEVTNVMTGKPIKLSDFRGKYVLLDFWATWCGPCVEEIPYLRKANERYKNRSDFVVISLSSDEAIEKPREFVKKNDMPWVQGFLDNKSDQNISQQYGVEGIPAIFLINPEGNLIASELRGEAIGTTLRKYLR